MWHSATVGAPTPTQCSHAFSVPIAATAVCVVPVMWSPWNVLNLSTASETWAAAHYTEFVCAVVNSEWQSLRGWVMGLLRLALLIVFPHLNVCAPPTEILEGGVKIIQNKYLSYAPQVNWLDIVKDGTALIMIEGNGPESEWKGWSF